MAHGLRRIRRKPERLRHQRYSAATVEIETAPKKKKAAAKKKAAKK